MFFDSILKFCDDTKRNTHGIILLRWHTTLNNNNNNKKESSKMSLLQIGEIFIECNVNDDNKELAVFFSLLIQSIYSARAINIKWQKKQEKKCYFDMLLDLVAWLNNNNKKNANNSLLLCWWIDGCSLWTRNVSKNNNDFPCLVLIFISFISFFKKKTSHIECSVKMWYF